MAGDNRVVLCGRLIERDTLRHTPGGVPILNFRIEHSSEQIESASPRKVICEVDCVAFDREARMLSAAVLGGGITVTGFLDRKGRATRRLVLHAARVEFETKE